MTRISNHSLLLLIALSVSPCEAADVLPAEIAPGIPKSQMMAMYLKQHAIKALDRRDAAFSELTTANLQRWQQSRRQFFLKRLGEPRIRTPLNAKVTGRLKRKDYRIEKLHFESQPGLHVTANLYLPPGQGPFPAVLHPTGHSASAKNRELYQMACITIVQGGCAVLCYDPIGQGERKQVFLANGKPLASTIQHTLMNQGGHLLGQDIASTMIWDGMRAIDYLQSRADILPDKIGCTGISGGGTQTSYLMALDERIYAAAPGCYLTGFRSLFNTIGPQDAEQNIYGQLAFGMDHADYVLMHLPKPTLIMAATKDYFAIEGAWALFRQGKRYATSLGFPERVDLVEPNTGHGFPPEMRVAAANWMRRWLLNNDTPISEGDLNPFLESDLNATRTGRALDLPGARTIFDIQRDKNRALAEARARGLADPANLRRRVRRLINAKPLSELPAPSIEKTVDGFIITSESGIQLPAQLVGNANSRTFAVLLTGRGKNKAIQSGTAERLAKKFNLSVLTVDLRGLGETKKAGRPVGFAEYFGPDWKDIHSAQLLGKSYVGMRAEDIWQIVRAWRKHTGKNKSKPLLFASGEAAIPALHAAALEPQLFGEITITDSIKSWSELLGMRIVRNQQPNLVFGALREYDLPMLRELLGAKLSFTDPISPDQSPE